MIHPLVRNNQWAFHSTKMRNRVFGKYGNTAGSEQFRDPVMDFRIYMIWSACKDDTMLMVVFKIF